MYVDEKTTNNIRRKYVKSIDISQEKPYKAIE